MTDKAAIRASAIFDLGARLDDALEASRGRVSEARGGVAAFAQAAKAIGALEAHVDRDVEDGALELEGAKVAKTWLARARAALENLGRQAENRVILCEGEARAYGATVEITKKAHDLELAKAPAVRAVEVEKVEAEGNAARRPSIKARRLAEADAPAKKAPRKKAAKKATKKAARKKAG